ncbi:2,3-diaminopropionate biosynthesis protein SbnB [Rheinheimera sp. 4Y26]|uniref:2,3-diaminopropionate biosynthesis protein SbnB n=1 Tax=Rheinheimera sp. 4Y26 TaxID=2977811 RepID=UPI0021B09A3B|nr:2,3-diaminopropionate biosynthesis protein SbnB [Rheinheimera sp. 4Y26]MCT6700351.1 2,3-diaminopropionate biosynthesis protein SbnB [Rheinheimera sp. 4Y26]
MVSNSFRILGRQDIQQIITKSYPALEQLICDLYRQHHQGKTINPDSYFLRFPEQPQNRIIALPAHLAEAPAVSGIKWISSFPDNIRLGLQRASATLILNDGATGFPFACLEAGLISAVRTTISAVAALGYLKPGPRHINCLAIIGCGFIAKHLTDSLFALGWTVGRLKLYDLDHSYATALQSVLNAGAQGQAEVVTSLAAAMDNADVIVTTTTAAQPYISDAGLLQHNPVVLNISLRDFSAELMSQANNITDDIQHCLKANTSLHLAYQQLGHHDFIHGHFGDLLSGNLQLQPDRPTIFSPFGLGVLDVAVGRYVYDEACRLNLGTVIDDFFGVQTRW